VTKSLFQIKLCLAGAKAVLQECQVVRAVKTAPKDSFQIRQLTLQQPHPLMYNVSLGLLQVPNDD